MKIGLVVGLFLFAGSSLAAQSELRLDPFSFIEHMGPDGQRFYSFPATARMRFTFGPRSGDTIPVVLPPGGLELGIATGEGLPPLEISLTETADGKLAVHSDGSGTLTLQTRVLAKRVGGLQGVRYHLTLSIDIVRMGQTANGWVQMTAADEVPTPEGAPRQSFYAVIGGTLDGLPPGFE